MTDKSIEKALVNYLVQDSNVDDLDMLSECIKNPENEALFEHYVALHYQVNAALHNPNIHTVKEHLFLQIKKDTRKRRLIKTRLSFFKYAAILVICLLIGSYLYKSKLNDSVEASNIPVIVNQHIKPGQDKATLTLSNGEEVPLDKGTHYSNLHVVSNGEEIVYEDKGTHVETEYHILTIPRGGTFFIKLSDGTKVWLNSETKLKYPTRFMEGATREVTLVYGEAYFEVSPSTANNGATFSVLNTSQKIEVLGTAFNVKAYADEPHIYTTLLEGKVAINYKDSVTYLKPNEQLHIDLHTKSRLVDHVNVKDIVSWKEGLFSFTKKPLKDIMKVLSRWYDVEVVFKETHLETITFSGVLSKNQNLEDILKTINNLSIIKNYTLYDRKIIIE